MANNKEEAGKGMPRPGEMPAARRPYATIDASATEVEGRDPAPGAGASKPAASMATDAKSAVKPETKPSEPRAKAAGPTDPKGNKVAAALVSLAARWRAAPLLTPLAAGAVGALLVLAVAQLLTPDRPPARPPEMNDLLRRLTDVESVLGTRPNSGLRSRVDEMGRSLGALGETQAKLARDTKALESKVGGGQEIPQELVGRLARLEEMLGAVSTADPAGQAPQLTALAGRLVELQKATRDASETAKSGIARFDGELSAIRTEAGRLAQRERRSDREPFTKVVKADADGEKRFAPFLRLYLNGNPLSDAAKASQFEALKAAGVKIDFGDMKIDK
jgi:hypothetical protein